VSAKHIGRDKFAVVDWPRAGWSDRTIRGMMLSHSFITCLEIGDELS
jgi:hypothetical protein